MALCLKFIALIGFDSSRQIKLKICKLSLNLNRSFINLTAQMSAKSK